MGRLALVCSLLLGLLLLTPPIIAQEEEDIEFDIFRQDNHIHALVDLAVFLTPNTITDLKAGIDLVVDYEIILNTPKKFWGATTVAKKKGQSRLGYRLVTKNFVVNSIFEQTETKHQFLSIGTMADFLRDSVSIPLSFLDSLNPEKRYRLQLKITRISLTSINLLSDDETASNDDSFLKSLFKNLLSVTGFGRREYSVKSRHFSLQEVLPRQK